MSMPPAALHPALWPTAYRLLRAIALSSFFYTTITADSQILSSCTCSRVHMGIKFARFLLKRGVGLDPDPLSTVPEPKGTADIVLSALLCLALALAFAYGVQFVAEERYYWGLAWVAVPTLCALSAVVSHVRGGKGGGESESRSAALL